MGLLSAIANGLKAVAAYFGYEAQRDAEKNAPDMQARAQGQTDQQIKDDATKAIATGNVADLQKDLAE